jgi:hypothetical protein
VLPQPCVVWPPHRKKVKQACSRAANLLLPLLLRGNGGY